MFYSVLAVGGLLFWLLVAAEVIYLYSCMGLERTKGSNATASLFGFVTLLFCFSNLKAWLLANWGWSAIGYVVTVAVIYISIGICWSFFFMWPRWGRKRKQIHKKKLAEWLESQGVRGDQCPDDLKKELNLVVFGNEDQEVIECRLRDVRNSYARLTGKVPDRYNAAQFKDLGEDFLDLVIHRDPESIEDRVLRREVSDLRKEWLKTQKVHRADLSIVIPERLLARFTERVTTPYVRRQGDKEWADVAAEPLFRLNKGKLGTWFAWWPVSMVWYAFNDLFHEIAMAAMKVFEGIGQALMHKQYKDVRADFEITTAPQDTTKV